MECLNLSCYACCLLLGPYKTFYCCLRNMKNMFRNVLARNLTRPSCWLEEQLFLSPTYREKRLKNFKNSLSLAGFSRLPSDSFIPASAGRLGQGDRPSSQSPRLYLPGIVARYFFPCAPHDLYALKRQTLKQRSVPMNLNFFSNLRGSFTYN